ncbi:hypothetical protein D1007_43169 [Hordeum vulgare]|nr:hypothetical protein D1007_43169 [Hordeum vulgare]
MGMKIPRVAYREFRIQRVLKVDGSNSDEEPDLAGIFEPAEPSAEVEETLHNIQDEQPTYADDEECTIFSGQGDDFQSYRVMPDVIDSQVCLSALHKFDEMCLAKNLSGYHAFSSMLSWNGKDLNPPICKDGDQLRKRFLVHLLSYIDNEAAHNISDVARAMISSIRKC